MDLNTIDSGTVLASPELDALIAEKWMGWKAGKGCDHWGWAFDAWLAESERQIARDHWSPSTDPAHAGEARRKADYWGVKRWYGSDGREGVRADIDKVECFCAFDETHNDKGKAEALATCRAIVGVLKAAKTEGGD